MRQLVGPHEHLEIFFWIDGWTRLEQCNTHPAFGQQLRSHAATRAGTNHAHIVSFRRTSDLRHRPAPYLSCAASLSGSSSASQQFVPDILQHVSRAFHTHRPGENGILILNAEYPLVAD